MTDRSHPTYSTGHVSFHTGSHTICRWCEEPWPCETARLKKRVEQLEETIAQVRGCPQLRCRGCQIALSRRPDADT